MGEVDNFTRVLNMLAGNEAISMISIRLAYISIYHTLLSSSLFDDFLHPKPTRDSLNKYVTVS
jgi:energy-converting hydrogenase Eha subunit F